jgi:hypothetical protein
MNRTHLIYLGGALLSLGLVAPLLGALLCEASPAGPAPVSMRPSSPAPTRSARRAQPSVPRASAPRAAAAQPRRSSPAPGWKSVPVRVTAPEPKFAYESLLAHDDPLALQELIASGKLDLHEIARRVRDASARLGEREVLIEALALAQSEGAQKVLLALVRDPLLEASLLGLVFEGLGRAHHPLEQVVEHLRATSQDPRPVQRASATLALGLLAREARDPGLRDELSAILVAAFSQASDDERRLEVARGLSETGHALSLAPLAQLSHDSPSLEIRVAATLGLARVPDVEAELPLLAGLADGTSADRVVAAQALGLRPATPHAFRALASTLQEDKSPAVRAVAAEGLVAWVQAGTLSPDLEVQARAVLAKLAAGEGPLAETARAVLAPKG